MMTRGQINGEDREEIEEKSREHREQEITMIKKRQSEREGQELTMMSKLENERYRDSIMDLRTQVRMRVRQLKVILCLRRLRDEIKPHPI